MTNAQARNEANIRLRARRKLLDAMELVPTPRVLRYAGDNSLPAVFGRWSDDVLEAAVQALSSPAKVTILKEAPVTKTAAAAKTFLVEFPTKNPKKAVGTQMTGTAPESTDETTYVVVNTAEDLKGLPGAALLALVNATRQTPIKKFANDNNAAEAAFQALTARAQPKQAGATKESAAPGAPKAPKPIAYEPKAKDQIRAVKAGSKVATAIDLLSQEGGVLLTDLENKLSETGAKVNARSWLGYDVKSVVGYGVRSEPADGDLRVFLVLPKGMKEPLAHKVAAPKPEPKPSAVSKAAAATKVKPEAASEASTPAKTADASTKVAGSIGKGGKKKAQEATT